MVLMKPLKSPFKINWPLVRSNLSACSLNYFLPKKYSSLKPKLTFFSLEDFDDFWCFFDDIFDVIFDNFSFFFILFLLWILLATARFRIGVPAILFIYVFQNICFSFRTFPPRDQFWSTYLWRASKFVALKARWVLDFFQGN